MFKSEDGAGGGWSGADVQLDGGGPGTDHHGGGGGGDSLGGGEDGAGGGWSGADVQFDGGTDGGSPVGAPDGDGHAGQADEHLEIGDEQCDLKIERETLPNDGANPRHLGHRHDVRAEGGGSRGQEGGER